MGTYQDRAVVHELWKKVYEAAADLKPSVHAVIFALGSFSRNEHCEDEWETLLRLANTRKFGLLVTRGDGESGFLANTSFSAVWLLVPGDSTEVIQCEWGDIIALELKV